MKSLATQMLNCHTELKTWTLNLSKLVFFFFLPHLKAASLKPDQLAGVLMDNYF